LPARHSIVAESSKASTKRRADTILRPIMAETPRDASALASP
jgi:hypothetical protein